MPAAGIVPVYLHSPCFDMWTSVKSVAPSGRKNTDTLLAVTSLPSNASIVSGVLPAAVSMICSSAWVLVIV